MTNSPFLAPCPEAPQAYNRELLQACPAQRPAAPVALSSRPAKLSLLPLHGLRCPALAPDNSSRLSRPRPAKAGGTTPALPKGRAGRGRVERRHSRPGLPALGHYRRGGARAHRPRGGPARVTCMTTSLGSCAARKSSRTRPLDATFLVLSVSQ